MEVAVLCEYSGIVRDSFIRKGHNAISYDILPSESTYGPHIQKDIMFFDINYWSKYDLLIAHPPCTYLSNSGVRWLYVHPDRWEKMKKAAIFFKYILDLPVDKIVVENPIMHKYGLEIIGRKYDQIIQPYFFGDPYQKSTCLWLKNLPKLEKTNEVLGREQKCWKEPPGPDRGKIRSKTYIGIAQAMAEQFTIIK